MKACTSLVLVVISILIKNIHQSTLAVTKDPTIRKGEEFLLENLGSQEADIGTRWEGLEGIIMIIGLEVMEEGKIMKKEVVEEEAGLGQGIGPRENFKLQKEKNQDSMRAPLEEQKVPEETKSEGRGQGLNLR